MNKALIAIDRSKSFRVYLTISTDLVQEAAKIHDTTPLASAGLGRVLTAAGLMGIMLKDDDNKLTLHFKGDGPARQILATAYGDGRVKGYISNPYVDLPLNDQGKLDVGGSAYWSEIAQMQTLDNLLMNGQINVVDYLERVPNGYISNQQELIQTLRERMGMVQPAMQGQTGAVQAGQGNTIDLAAGSGYGNLQRAINQTGMEGMDLSQIRV